VQLLQMEGQEGEALRHESEAKIRAQLQAHQKGITDSASYEYNRERNAYRTASDVTSPCNPSIMSKKGSTIDDV
jgi:hypothetical protein